MADPIDGNAAPDGIQPLSLAPVAPQERLAIVDVLRGIAVFGIFLVNMPLFLAPAYAFFNWEENVLWTTPVDRLSILFLYIFAQGKFYTLFSFLFGLGFGVQLLRVTQRDSQDFERVYRRRLTVLLLIGLIHFMFVWWGDVLHVYALLGFLLFFFQERNDKSLLLCAALLTLVPLLSFSAIAIRNAYFPKPAAEQQKRRAARAEQIRTTIESDLKTNSSGTVGEILKRRASHNLDRLVGEIGWATELFANFLLGLWACRRRILQNPAAHLPLLKRLAFIALPLGFAVTVADLTWAYLHPGATAPLWRDLLYHLREYLARPAIAFGYAAILVLIGVKSWMSPFAAVGRMALTNYLLHSLVFTTIANTYGLGLYGKVPPLQGLVWCVLFYAAQIPFSVWWLRRHNYGPAEWAWRSLTYGARQPWLRPAPNSL